MNLKEIKSQTELVQAYSVMKELRTELSFEDFIQISQIANKADEYTLVGLYEAGECLGVMGYRILHDFVHGRHLYIDDLVICKNQRSKGLGALFLKEAEKIAKNNNCVRLRLCTGVQNSRAIEFYEREGWEAKAFAFKKTI